MLLPECQQVFFAEPAEEQAHLAPAPAWGGASALFAFASREERERAVEALKGQPELGRALPGAREAAAACAAILEVRRRVAGVIGRSLQHRRPWWRQHQLACHVSCTPVSCAAPPHQPNRPHPPPPPPLYPHYPQADPAWLSRVTEAWQRGLLSNLDYLLFLNLASGRSFTDLSQYPVS